MGCCGAPRLWENILFAQFDRRDLCASKHQAESQKLVESRIAGAESRPGGRERRRHDTLYDGCCKILEQQWVVGEVHMELGNVDRSLHNKSPEKADKKDQRDTVKVALAGGLSAAVAVVVVAASV